MPTDVQEVTDSGGGGRFRASLTNRDAGGQHGVRSIFAKYALGFLLLGLIVLFGILRPDTFFTWDTAKSILLQQAVIACLAFGVLCTLVVGEFDLSVGYTLGFAAVVAAALSGKAGMAGAPVLLLTFATGAAIGLVNGVLVAKLRISSLIATLGVGIALSGLSVGVSGSQTLFAGISPIIGQITNTTILGLASCVWLVAALGVVMYYVLAHTPTGRRLYATGGSEHVARLAGVRTDRLKIAAFVVGGILAALAGILQVGQSGAANPSYGANLLLPAYAAAFLGSTGIRPGFFNVWGTVLAILVLAVGFTGLNLLGVPFWTDPVFNGVALIVGVVLSRSERRGMTG